MMAGWLFKPKAPLLMMLVLVIAIVVGNFINGSKKLNSAKNSIKKYAVSTYLDRTDSNGLERVLSLHGMLYNFAYGLSDNSGIPIYPSHYDLYVFLNDDRKDPVTISALARISAIPVFFSSEPGWFQHTLNSLYHLNSLFSVGKEYEGVLFLSPYTLVMSDPIPSQVNQNAQYFYCSGNPLTGFDKKQSERSECEALTVAEHLGFLAPTYAEHDNLLNNGFCSYSDQENLAICNLEAVFVPNELSAQQLTKTALGVGRLYKKASENSTPSIAVKRAFFHSMVDNCRSEQVNEKSGGLEEGRELHTLDNCSSYARMLPGYTGAFEPANLTSHLALIVAPLASLETSLSIINVTINGEFLPKSSKTSVFDYSNVEESQMTRVVTASAVSNLRLTSDNTVFSQLHTSAFSFKDRPISSDGQQATDGWFPAGGVDGRLVEKAFHRFDELCSVDTGRCSNVATLENGFSPSPHFVVGEAFHSHVDTCRVVRLSYCRNAYSSLVSYRINLGASLIDAENIAFEQYALSVCGVGSKETGTAQSLLDAHTEGLADDNGDSSGELISACTHAFARNGHRLIPSHTNNNQLDVVQQRQFNSDVKTSPWRLIRRVETAHVPVGCTPGVGSDSGSEPDAEIRTGAASVTPSNPASCECQQEVKRLIHSIPGDDIRLLELLKRGKSYLGAAGSASQSQASRVTEKDEEATEALAGSDRRTMLYDREADSGLDQHTVKLDGASVSTAADDNDNNSYSFHDVSEGCSLTWVVVNGDGVGSSPSPSPSSEDDGILSGVLRCALYINTGATTVAGGNDEGVDGSHYTSAKAASSSSTTAHIDNELILELKESMRVVLYVNDILIASKALDIDWYGFAVSALSSDAVGNRTRLLLMETVLVESFHLLSLQGIPCGRIVTYLYRSRCKDSDSSRDSASGGTGTGIDGSADGDGYSEACSTADYDVLLASFASHICYKQRELVHSSAVQDVPVLWDGTNTLNVTWGLDPVRGRVEGQLERIRPHGARPGPSTYQLYLTPDMARQAFPPAFSSGAEESGRQNCGGGASSSSVSSGSSGNGRIGDSAGDAMRYIFVSGNHHSGTTIMRKLLSHSAHNVHYQSEEAWPQPYLVGDASKRFQLFKLPIAQTGEGSYVYRALLRHEHDCRVIFLVRDLRDILHSKIVRHPDVDPLTVIQFLVPAWVAAMKTGMLLRTLRTTLLVRYEDLFDAPRYLTLRRVFAFAGLDFRPEYVEKNHETVRPVYRTVEGGELHEHFMPGGDPLVGNFTPGDVVRYRYQQIHRSFEQRSGAWKQSPHRQLIRDQIMGLSRAREPGECAAAAGVAGGESTIATKGCSNDTCRSDGSEEEDSARRRTCNGPDTVALSSSFPEAQRYLQYFGYLEDENDI